MPTTVRRLTQRGEERFLAYLARLREGEVAEPPRHLLSDPASAAEVPVDLAVEVPRFRSRLEVGKYLWNQLKPLGSEVLDRDRGLWAWLSLFYFDQVCPPGPGGARRPGQDYRHVPDFGYRFRHRHLLFGPFDVYRRHGIRSILLLTGLPSSESAIYHEIAARMDLIANRGVIDAAMLMYFDPRRLEPKRGVQAARAAPGTIRRFVRVLQQLDMTYDIYGLSGREILDLLPEEFDRWQPASARRQHRLPLGRSKSLGS